MKDNKGFSLVELVIVVAILAILGGFVFVGLGLLTGQYARECANDISAALGKEKNYSLTRSATVDCYMELVYDADDGYHVRYYQPKNAIVKGDNPSSDWVLAGDEKVGSKRVYVNCDFTDNSSTVIRDGQSVIFIYDRVSGALKASAQSDGITIGIDDAVRSAIESDTAVKCNKITIDYGRTYEITLYPATGKHELARKFD